MNNNFTLTQEDKLEIARLVAEMIKGANGTGTGTGTGKGGKRTGAPELVEYVKANGEKILCTKAQRAHYEAQAAAAAARREETGKTADEEREEAYAAWEEKRAAYKPSKALIDAIKADRAAITRKVAKAKYGFVGTKDDLATLKAQVCGK